MPLVISLFLLSPLTPQGEPQAPEEPSELKEAEVPTLTLSFELTIGQVGQEVSFPIKVTSSTHYKEPFQIILRFPPSKLEYVKVGVGKAPREAGWNLTPELRQAPPAFDMSFVEILVEPGEGDLFPQGGELAFVYFTLVEASPEHAIELSVSIKPLGETPLEVETEPAEIIALPEGTFACFFYLH